MNDPSAGGVTDATERRRKQMTTQMKVPDYFGGCPQCGRNDGYVNAGKSHVFICREHKTSWAIGSNLFSSWRDQTDPRSRLGFVPPSPTGRWKDRYEGAPVFS